MNFKSSASKLLSLTLLLSIPALQTQHLLASRKSDHKKTCKINNPLSPIKNIIIISLENNSFDYLYGTFPGANGIANSVVTQVSANVGTVPGTPFAVLPPVFNNDPAFTIDAQFPTNLPNAPFEINQYASMNQQVPTANNQYFQTVLSVNNGKMDSFIAFDGLPASAIVGSGYNTIGGLGGSITFGHWNTQLLPMYNLAKEFVLCDNLYDSFLSGTGPNRLYQITGQFSTWDTTAKPIPASIQAIASPVPFKRNDGVSFVTKDGNIDGNGVYINNLNTANQVNPAFSTSTTLPSLNTPTIGDQLDSIGVSWTWYGGFWNRQIAGTATIGTTNPFSYFTNFSPVSDQSYAHTHTKDTSEFLADLNAGNLPAVTWYIPTGLPGDPDEHPGNPTIFATSGTVMTAEQNTFAIVEAIRNSKYWDQCLIIVTYDEYGGGFDHAVPPAGFGSAPDGYGPGPRIPTLVISPFAKKNFVDHTFYETISITKFIEKRYNLPSLTPRLANTNDLTNALDMTGGKLVCPKSHR